MREAMLNERLAVREKLAEAYRGQLTLLQKQVMECWGAQTFVGDGPLASEFAHCVHEGLADSVIVYDRRGMSYPTINVDGRSAEANTDLLALEKWPDRNDPAFKNALARLEATVTNYGTVTLTAAQRRFLMHELQRLDPNAQFPTLDAEELAARFLEANPSLVWGKPFYVTRQNDVWSMAEYGREEKVMVLFTTTGLRNKLANMVRKVGPPKGVNLTVLAPGEDPMTKTTLVTLPFTSELPPLTSGLPGWGLALSLDDDRIFDTETAKHVKLLVAVACTVIAAMSVLSLIIARSFGKQVQLTRLKNDLVANVSHELKTPLTAMRALVDTLLDTERFDEKTTREYLQLLATENARLSRLIENFLAFSRLERNKFKFQFESIDPRQVVDGAVAAMGERAGKVTVEAASQIPSIRGDHDALVTAVLNLLDNAWKYSGDEKHIVLRTEARNGVVCFAVGDNGIGLSPGETKRVFRRFYQTDQRLARTAGGCGLGLSIVQSIVEAHHGSVRVQSEAGFGSTFTIEIPAVAEGVP
jgi:signal transduction histidine kinase